MRVLVTCQSRALMPKELSAFSQAPDAEEGKNAYDEAFYSIEHTVLHCSGVCAIRFSHDALVKSRDVFRCSKHRHSSTMTCSANPSVAW